MSYAIDLNARQSGRTLEQAIRQQAHTILEPRMWGDDRHLLCRLEPHGNPLDLHMVPVVTLTVLAQVNSACPSDSGGESNQPVAIEQIRDLAGTYVDAVMRLGEQRYLFSTDVIRVLPAAIADDPPRVHVSRPPTLQVAQRRRFRRLTLSHSAQVELQWQRDNMQMGGVGWLFNISGDGMACRTEARIAESLWIGDEMQMEFTLAPGDTERFRLKGVLCNKTPTGSLGKVILGIHFQTQEPQADETALRLRQRLVERASQLIKIRRGADS